MVTSNRRGRRFARITGLAAAATIALGATVGTTTAAAEGFMSNQALGAGNAKASVGAASGSNVTVWGVSDHTWCPAVARGYAGYTSSPNSGGNSTDYHGADCTNGYAISHWNTNGYSWHGAAWNRNASTVDNFDYANVLW